MGLGIDLNYEILPYNIHKLFKKKKLWYTEYSLMLIEYYMFKKKLIPIKLQI